MTKFFLNTLPTPQVLDKIFNALIERAADNPTEQTRINLVRHMVMYQYEQATHRRQQFSVIYTLINALPVDLEENIKLDLLCARLRQYKAMPVMTSHPTRVISNQALFTLHEITQLALLPVHAELEAALTTAIESLLQGSLSPETNLTPQQEAEMALFIYQNMLDSFPLFVSNVIRHYLDWHGGNFSNVEQHLKPALSESFRHISSWVKGDADGNPNVTAQTMARAVPTQQIAIIKLYLKRLDPIISQWNDAKLLSIRAYLDRCLHAIECGIWFDLAGSDEAKNGLIERLKDCIQAAAPVVQEQLESLCDLIALEGFFGGMKEYVRQTTAVNGAVLNELIPGYQSLTRLEKFAKLEQLSADPTIFAGLRDKKASFSAETNAELQRLYFLSQHTDIFPSYIGSDTEDKLNADEFRVLLHFATYLNSTLRIGQVSQFPVNTLPLCETPEDLEHFEQIMRDMLDDKNMRAKIVASGFISYVSGPSDLGKTGGITVYVSLLRNQLLAEEILAEYKSKYPELGAVELRVLNGFGGDLKRSIGSARQQAHSTNQGMAAYDVLGAPYAFSSYLHQLVGFASGTHYRVKELLWMKTHFREQFNTLIKLEKKAIHWYEDFISRPSSKALLIALTDFNIQKKLNTGSRPGSKSSSDDPTKVRAIGFLNLFLLTGVNWDIFMSVAGLHDLSPEEQQTLPFLFQYSTGVKEIVYKVLYAIAVSNIPRARSKLATDNQSAHNTLNYIEACAYEILAQIPCCLPKGQAVSIDKSQPSHTVALELMAIFNSDLAEETRELLPRFNDLADCVDAYQANPTPATLENAVLACRGFPLAAGPRFFEELRSPYYHQELESPWPDVIEAAETPRRFAHQP
jgi:phosphoenolpyruvate carboxylase